MYFYIVHLKEPKKYAVIPFHWLHDGTSKMLQKFVNNGLNSNQTHLCYWAEEVDVVDYAAHFPNFQANISNEFPCRNNEATCHCFVLKFACKHSVYYLNLTL